MNKLDSLLVDFTQKELIEALEIELHARIDDVTFWTWQKKGYIQPSAYIHRGSRKNPIYYRSDFPKLVNTIQELNRSGKIRLRVR